MVWMEGEGNYLKGKGEVLSNKLNKGTTAAAKNINFIIPMSHFFWGKVQWKNPHRPEINDS